MGHLLIWIIGLKQTCSHWILKKTSFIQFLTKSSSHIPISVGCDNNIKSNTTNIKFLGIMIDNTLTWNSHIETFIPKVSVACFVVGAIKPFVTQGILKMVYHFYFHSLINYGTIFWGNSSYCNSIFKLWKRIIKIIRGIGIWDSYRELYKILNIILLISQHIFSIVLFVVNNKNQFRMNSEIHSINTMNNSNFHQILSHLTIYQKGPFVCILRYITFLPPDIKYLSHNIKKFKSFLRSFLHQHSLYRLDKYFNYGAVVWYILTNKFIFIILSLAWNFEVCVHM